MVSCLGQSGVKSLKRALRFAFPYRNSVVGILLITLLLAGLNATEPLVFKLIFDNLTHGHYLRPLLLGIGVLLGIGLVREGLTAFSNWLTWHSRLGLHYQLLEATVGRLHRMPLHLQRSEGVGATITKLDRSIQGFIGAVTQILFQVLPAIVYLIISVVIMIQLDWRLAVLVMAFTPLPGLIAAFAAPEQICRERSLLERWSRIYSRFNEVLSGIVTVRSFAMEDAEKHRFLRDVEEANRIVIRGVGRDTGFEAASNLVIALARIAAIALGGVLVLGGEMTLGTLVAFLGYVGGLFGPVQGLSGAYQALGRASVSLDEIFFILDFQEHLGDSPEAREIISIVGEVAFKGVRFGYTEGEPLLKGIDLTVHAGEKVAIVGPSGSGKTTLMALLMRFYDPREGVITLDGTDLRKLKQSSVRRMIGVVLQDPLLFNDTVRNNIAYGKPEASMDEIRRAACMANAHEFIDRLPEKYDTLVGERGSRLSVGERQRITIARAVIKNPPLIVLDEATSSLDAESEALVQDALDGLMKGRTAFVIAHRLSTVVHADRIIVLKEGRIIESAKHEELMRRKGYYRSLVDRQTCGLIRNEGE